MTTMPVMLRSHHPAVVPQVTSTPVRLRPAMPNAALSAVPTAPAASSR